MNVSFDIDGSTRSYQGKDIASTHQKVKEHIRKGDKVTFITRRGYFDNHVGLNGEGLESYIKNKFGDIPIIFTNGYFKFQEVRNNNIDLHYEDDPKEIKILNDIGINTVFINEDKSQERQDNLERQKMPELYNKTLLFIDSGGIYQSFAERLIKEFGTVLYFSNWEENESDLRVAKKATGEGTGLIKVDNYEKYVYDADTIFFPGCTRSHTQEDLINRGFNVFGSGNVAKLENNRKYFLEKLKEWGLNVPKYEEVEGIDSLLKRLEKIKEVCYIKFDTFRSDMQTYKHWNYESSKLKFEELRRKQGTYANKMIFLIVYPIKGIETGRDTFCVQGQLPKKFLGGYEIKNKSYVARVITNDNLPQPMQDFASKVADLYKETMVSSFWSDEVRVDKPKYYPLDFTARLGLPPNEIQQRLCKNLGEIIYYGSQGILVEPEFEKEYAAQIFLDVNNDFTDWCPLKFPAKYKDYIRCYNYTVEDDIYWVIPPADKKETTICAVVGIGDTLEEAEQQCIEIAKSIEGENIGFDEHEFIKSQDVINEGSEVGINIFD